MKINNVSYKVSNNFKKPHTDLQKTKCSLFCRVTCFHVFLGNNGSVRCQYQQYLRGSATQRTPKPPALCIYLLLSLA